ncbi:MAG: hypothetical protein ACRC7O_15820 [Fimbriiglobus sp.]
MSIELTVPQQEVLDAEGAAARVVDPRTNDEYVLVPVRDFEAVRAALEDDERQRTIRRVGRRNAVGRMGEAP